MRDPLAEAAAREARTVIERIGAGPLLAQLDGVVAGRGTTSAGASRSPSPAPDDERAPAPSTTS
jgi:hypothetical protein